MRPPVSAARRPSRRPCWSIRSACRSRSSPATTAMTTSSPCAAARCRASGLALDLPAVRRRGPRQVHRPDRRLARPTCRSLPTLVTGERGAEGDRARRLAEQHLAPDRRPGWHSGRTLKTLRDAYAAATSDPEFLEKAKAQGLPVEPLVGDAVGRGRGQGDGSDAGDGRVPQGRR